MPDQEDVRRIALALPGTSEGSDGFGFSVLNKDKHRGFVWSWKERVEPKKPRVERDDVVAVRTVDLADKEALLASGDEALFTEPHYNGFPAVLVRLPVVDPELLEELIVDAWRTLAPRALVEEWEASRG
jgi:hypothetical protein